MDNKMKVLVACPTSDRKGYCQAEYLDMVQSLTYKNYDILIVDNSDTMDNFKKIKKRGIITRYVSPKNKSNVEYIAESMEVLRLYAIKKGYEAVVIIESDIFPPANVIERLLMAELPVVSGMYHIDFGPDRHLMLQQVEPVGERRETWNVTKNDILWVDGQVKQVFAAGLGCILINTSVLELIKFRFQPFDYAHPDTFFAHDLHMLNIPQYQDTSIMCDHKNAHWVHV